MQIGRRGLLMGLAGAAAVSPLRSGLLSYAYAAGGAD